MLAHSGQNHPAPATKDRFNCGVKRAAQPIGKRMEGFGFLEKNLFAAFRSPGALFMDICVCHGLTALTAFADSVKDSNWELGANREEARCGSTIPSFSRIPERSRARDCIWAITVTPNEYRFTQSLAS
jgi:hypothetical protein